MDEVSLPGGGAKREDHREQDERRQPGPALQVADQAGSVVGRQAEIAVRAGADHLDLEAPSAQIRNRAVDEAAGEVLIRARIRGREDRNAKWTPMSFRRLESRADRNASHVQGVFGCGNEKLEQRPPLPLPSMTA